MHCMSVTFCVPDSEWVALQDSPWQHWLAKWYLWSSNRWTVKATSVLFSVQFDAEQNLFWYTCRNPPRVELIEDSTQLKDCSLHSVAWPSQVLLYV